MRPLLIQLDDTVAELYASRLRPTQTLEQVLTIQLTRFAELDPRDRVLVVTPEQRAQLEEYTNRLPLLRTDDLVKRVAELAELSIGRIRFRWTPAQYRQLKEKAERWRVPPSAYAERVVRQIEEQFFDEMPRESLLQEEVKR